MIDQRSIDRLAPLFRASILVLVLLLGMPTTLHSQEPSTARATRPAVALKAAIQQGDVEDAREAIERGAPVACRSKSYCPLMEAVRRGELRVVRLLLAAGADPDHVFPNGSTILSRVACSWALWSRDARTRDRPPEQDLLRSLAQLVASMSETTRQRGAEDDFSPEFPLHCALRFQNAGLARVLTGPGFDPSPVRAETREKLLLELKRNRLSVAEVLIAAGVQPPTESRLLARSWRGSVDATRLLFEALGDELRDLEQQLAWIGSLDSPYDARMMVFLDHLAAMGETVPPQFFSEYLRWYELWARDGVITDDAFQRITPVFRRALELGADPNGGGEEPPLYYAVQADSAELVSFLIDLGTSVDLCRRFGGHPEPEPLSTWARKTASAEVFARLAAAGADEVSCPVPPGYRALAEAVRTGNIQAARAALDAGGDPSKRPESWQPLLWPAVDDPELVRLLLDHGADPNDCGEENQCPLARAAAIESLDSMDMLLAAGADIDARDGVLGSTVLMKEVRSDEPSLPVIRALLAAGSSLEARDDSGRTALAKAIYWGTPAVVELLLESGADPNETYPTGNAHPLVEAIDRVGLTDDTSSALRIVRRLLEAGADATGRCGHRGHISPLEAATDWEDIPSRLLRLLKRYGAVSDMASVEQIVDDPEGLETLVGPASPCNLEIPPMLPSGPRLVVQTGHQGRAVTALAESPSGRLIASGSDDGTVVLWDRASGRQLWSLLGELSPVVGLAFENDDTLTLMQADDVLTRWSTSDRRFLSCARTDPSRARDLSPWPKVIAGTWHEGWTYAITEDEQFFRWSGHPEAPAERLPASDNDALQWHDVAHLAIAPGSDLRFLVVETRGEISLIHPDTGRIKEILDLQEEITAHAVDGSRLAVGGRLGRVVIVDLDTGDVLRDVTVEQPAGVRLDVRGLSFRNPDRVVVWQPRHVTFLEWRDGTLRRRQTHDLDETSETTASLTLADGGLAAGTDRGEVVLIEQPAKESTPRTMSGVVTAVRSLDLDRDARRLLVQSDRPRIWEPFRGRLLATPDSWSVRHLSSALIADGTRAVLGGFDGSIEVWDLDTHRRIHHFIAHDNPVVALTVTPDGRTLASGADWTLGLWAEAAHVASDDAIDASRIDGHDPSSAWSMWRLGDTVEAVPLPWLERQVVTIDIAPTGELLASHNYGWLSAWSVSEGGPIADLAPYSRDLGTFDTQSSRRAVTIEGLDAWGVELVDPARPEPLVTLPVPRRPTAIDLAGAFLAAGDYLGSLLVWDAQSFETRWQAQLGASVTDVKLAPQANLIAASLADGTVRLLRLDDGNELMALVTLDDRTWISVAPDGRFDTNRPESLRGLHWVHSDEPFASIPLEAFLREYFEPSLLPRLLAGEPLTPVRPLASLNRIQPAVRFVAVEADDEAFDRVSLVLEVESIQRSQEDQLLESEVWDVHVFRDGRLVAVLPEGGGRVPLDPGTRSARLEVRDLRLPRDGRSDTVFSAHAFNRDRIKSTTIQRSVAIPSDLPRRRGRAWIVTIGSDTTRIPDTDLAYAASDAVTLARALAQRLEASGAWDQVIALPLVSYAEQDRATGPVDASAQSVRAALSRLAGKPVGDFRGTALDALEAVRPEDLVVLFFAGHGVVDHRGDFVMLTADTQMNAAQPGAVVGGVRSGDLSDWLRGIDAGTLVMIVDTCYSAATVETEGFKAGPFGHRGLGQLAWDKGMQLLVASQSDSAAIESRRLGHGLLVYAMLREGLDGSQADVEPRDGAIHLGELLAWTAERVPKLHEALEQEATETPERDVIIVPDAGRVAPPEPWRQQPILFDFDRDPRPVLLHVPAQDRRPAMGQHDRGAHPLGPGTDPRLDATSRRPDPDVDQASPPPSQE